MHGLHHLRVAVAEQHRAGADQQVDIFLAVLVPDARALALADDDAGVEIAEPAAGQHGLRAGYPVGLGACIHLLSPSRTGNRPAERLGVG
jgi:hypothetical protein